MNDDRPGNRGSFLSTLNALRAGCAKGLLLITGREVSESYKISVSTLKVNGALGTFVQTQGSRSRRAIVVLSTGSSLDEVVKDGSAWLQELRPADGWEIGPQEVVGDEIVRVIRNTKDSLPPVTYRAGKKLNFFVKRAINGRPFSVVLEIPEG